MLTFRDAVICYVMHDSTRITILYDDACKFCRTTVGALILWDRNAYLCPVPIQSPEGERLLSALAPAERIRSAHAFGPDGRLRSGGAAASTVLLMLPGGRPLAWLADLAAPITDIAYRAVTAARPLLSRLTPSYACHASEALIAKRRATCE